eukprot:GEZU01025087.1.p2 GENE.GEZU01025087.1~~GEZU01025087.1.p2  ORF type:complete len:145 (+),score=25.63 GEZU01025087.1:485-919(+)
MMNTAATMSHMPEEYQDYLDSLAEEEEEDAERNGDKWAYVEQGEIDEKWLTLPQKEAALARLNQKIEVLEVENGELSSLKPKKQTYVRQANIFFMTSKETLHKDKKAELEAAKQERKHLENEIASLQRTFQSFKDNVMQRSDRT